MVNANSQVTTVISGLDYPIGAALDGTDLYFGLYNSSIIAKIDVTQSTPVAKTVATGVKTPIGLLVDKNNLYVSGSSIQVLDISSPNPTPKTVVDVGGSNNSMTLSGSVMYITNAPYGVISVDISLEKPVAKTLLTGFQTLVGITTEDSILYVTDYSAGQIITADLTQDSLVKDTLIEGLNDPTAVNINGGFLYVTTQNNIERYDLNQISNGPETLVKELTFGALTAFDGLDLYIVDAGTAGLNNGRILKLEISQPVFGTVPNVCDNMGMVNRGGGSPTGGTYSGKGVTDNGDGVTFSFDPTVAGGAGSYTITYTAINSNTVTQTLDVVKATTASVTSPDTAAISEGVQTLTGMPAGGTFSGEGVSGSTFDPATVGEGTHTVKYTYTDENGCTAEATQDIFVQRFPSSIYEAEGDNIRIYPNPTKGLVSWNGVQAQTAEVYNNTGRMVLNAVQPVGVIDITSLPKGMYILMIHSAEGVHTSKVMKE